MYASYEKPYEVLAKQFGGFFEHASRLTGTLAELGFTMGFTHIRFTLEYLLYIKNYGVSAFPPTTTKGIDGSAL